MKRDKDKIIVQTIGKLTELRQQVGGLEILESGLEFAENEIRESEDKYQRLFELSPMGIVVLDMKGVITACNSAVCTTSGYSKDDFIGKHFSKVATIRAGDIPKFLKMFASLIRGKIPKPLEVTYTRKDGTTAWTEAHISLLKVSGKKIGIQVIQNDITERKQTEKALRESEERHRAIVEQAPESIVLIDAETGALVDFNDRAHQNLGYSLEEFAKLKIPDFEVIESEEEVTRHIDKIVKEGTDFFETHHRTKDGEIRDIQVSSRAISIGGKTFVQSIWRDITERKQAEDLIHSQRELAVELGATGELMHGLNICLDAALHASAMDCGGIYLLDETTGAMDLIVHKGLSADFVRTATHFDADAPNVRLVMARMPAYARHQELPIPLDDTERSEKLRTIAIVPVLHMNQVVGCLNVSSHTLDEMPVVARDALETVAVQIGGAIARLRAEQALRESEERYRALVNLGATVGEAIVMLQDSERGQAMHIFVSNEWPRVTGYSRKELLGISFLDLLHPRHRAASLKRHGRKMRGEIVPGLFEMSIIRKDGTEVPVEVTSAYTTYKGERANVAFIRDITQRKQAEEKEKQLQQELHLASRLATVGEMASGIAHEINNPLTGVVGFSSLLLKKELPDDIRKDVNVIHEGAKRIASIVNRMLTFARQHKPERTPVNINDIIKTTLAMRAYEMESSNIKVTTQLASDIPLTFVDAGQLQQVFLNIVLNAEMEMKLAHGGGNLTVKTERIDNTIRASFKDDGPGIPKKNLDRLFDPFFTTRDPDKGTGLGLSIGYSIVTQHGGKIYARSRLGKGATFFVELPILTKVEQLRMVEPAAEVSRTLSRARILVVDDDTAVQEFLTTILTEEGHQVEIVENGDDALEKVGSEDYDVILLDIKLPGMSGIELYKYMQKAVKSLARRVVFITGDTMSKDTMDFLFRTRAPYITKPFDNEQLMKDVDRILTEGA